MASYSNHPRYYEDILAHPEVSDWELKIYKKLLPNNLKNLVDIGCGTGDFLEDAKKIFPQVLGLELNDYAVKKCKEKKIPVKKRNALKTGLPSNFFDVVRAAELLEHFQDAEKFIKECKRILKKNGYLVLHIPSQWSAFYPITNFWDDYTHVRPYTKRGITRLLSDFQITTIYIHGYTVGRNVFESMLGKIIGKYIPFTWFVIGEKITN
ncbi:MAG: class I SAM-dependent methyltransferase [Patescibacteria group bacterium]|nr:class I SAM-dependent methyltransferase [Patescibacteria group bacterium]